ncbi:Arv1 protein [Dillenia turbinata]|uniref:Protein ARV n=1 Tax=Dillenia turbinata TaxID=194707 RepID=A0AAN8UUP6_9MAGN
MDTRCVHCGSQIKVLFIQYSPGNIRLMTCEHCKAVADEYIECEILIIFIDMILHKPDAYRHLLYNMVREETVNLKGLFWKSALFYLLLDVCILEILDGILVQTLWSLLTSPCIVYNP